MNILMVHPHDIFHKSEPWTRRVKSIACEFVKRGHRVKIVYFPVAPASAGTPPPVTVDGYEAIALSRYPSPAVFLKNTAALIRIAGWADVVHFQKCHHYGALPALVGAYLNRKPVHYDWDDWEEMIWYESCGRGMHSRFIGLSFKVLERWIPVLSDTVSVASRQLKLLTVGCGVDPERIFPAPVGADLARFHGGIDGAPVRAAYSINGPLVLYIGQLHGAQYIDLYIRAANIVLHKRPDVRFMIVGEGFMEGTLREMVQDLGLGDKVIFTGAVAQDAIPGFIAAASVCVASFRDTLVTRCKSPLKIVEYLACGKAIVASNVGEVRRMVGGTGILVKEGDAHALAEGILRVVEDKAVQKAFEDSSRKRSQTRYNWGCTAESLLKAYSCAGATRRSQEQAQEPGRRETING